MISNNDEIIKSFHDSIIYKSDLNILINDGWLNDRLIGFFYEYFERITFKKEIFLNPSSVQLMKIADFNEAKNCIMDSLELDQKNQLFLPLNNNNKIEQSGGSHWSLLWINKETKTLYHLDSMNNSNEREAKHFYSKFKIYFQLDHFQSLSFPQQINSNDCGVYVIGNFFFFVSFL
jgi:sentrin-specific protease 8